MNSERDQAFDAVVLMFWMTCNRVGEPIILKLTGPDRDDAPRVRVPLEQVQRIELQCAVEEQLNVVQQKDVVGCANVSQFSKKLNCHEVATRIGNSNQLSPQSSTQAENGSLSPLRQCAQEAGLAGSGRTDQKNELAIQAADFCDNTI